MAVVIALAGAYKINFPPHRPALADLQAAATPEMLARGAKIGVICAGCHSLNGKPPLVGPDSLGSGGPTFGRLYAPNLTPADDQGLVGRSGHSRDSRGRPQERAGTRRHTSDVFRHLSDSDVQSVVAFLRAQSAADQASPPAKLNVLGEMFIGAVFPKSAQPPMTEPVVAPPETISRVRQVPRMDRRLPHVPRRTSGWSGPEGPGPAGRAQFHDARSVMEPRRVRADDSRGCRAEQAHPDRRDALESDFQVRER